MNLSLANKPFKGQLFCTKLNETVLAALPLLLIVFLSAPNVGVASAASSFAFTVDGQSSGNVGESHFSFTGSGLQPNYAYDVYFDGWTHSYRGQAIARVYTDGLGNIKPEYFYIAPIPQVVGGVHNVELVDVYYAATGYFDLADCGDVSFRVLPSFVYPNQVYLGDIVEVTVYGFTSTDSVGVFIDGSLISPCTIEQNGPGSFVASFLVSGIPGPHSLIVFSPYEAQTAGVIFFIQPFATPEYSFGALLALCACLAAFGSIQISKRIRPKVSYGYGRYLERSE